MEEQCDQITHCRDESDKDNFKLTEYKDNHNSKVPPFTINKTDKSVVGHGQGEGVHQPDKRARHLRVQSYHRPQAGHHPQVIVCEADL